MFCIILQYHHFGGDTVCLVQYGAHLKMPKVCRPKQIHLKRAKVQLMALCSSNYKCTREHSLFS